MNDTSQQAAPLPGEGESLLPIKAVLRRVGIGRTEIYEEMKAGTFPRQVKRGRRSLWVESEIAAWIDCTIRQSRGQGSSSAGIR